MAAQTGLGSPHDAPHQTSTTLEASGGRTLSQPDQAGLEVDGRKHYSDPEAIQLGHSDLEVSPIHRYFHGSTENDGLQAYHPAVARNKDAEGSMPCSPDNAEYKESAVDTPRRIIYVWSQESFGYV
jgi:hypothetical protein